MASNCTVNESLWKSGLSERECEMSVYLGIADGVKVGPLHI